MSTTGQLRNWHVPLAGGAIAHVRQDRELDATVGTPIEGLERTVELLQSLRVIERTVEAGLERALALEPATLARLRFRERAMLLRTGADRPERVEIQAADTPPLPRREARWKTLVGSALVAVDVMPSHDPRRALFLTFDEADDLRRIVAATRRQIEATIAPLLDDKLGLALGTVSERLQPVHQRLLVELFRRCETRRQDDDLALATGIASPVLRRRVWELRTILRDCPAASHAVRRGPRGTELRKIDLAPYRFGPLRREGERFTLDDQPLELAPGVEDRLHMLVEAGSSGVPRDVIGGAAAVSRLRESLGLRHDSALAINHRAGDDVYVLELRAQESQA